MPSQRNTMRGLVARFGMNPEKVIPEYAAAERRGEVKRKRNERNIEPEDYARRLWHDYVRKGWISGDAKEST